MSKEMKDVLTPSLLRRRTMQRPGLLLLSDSFVVHSYTTFAKTPLITIVRVNHYNKVIARTWHGTPDGNYTWRVTRRLEFCHVNDISARGGLAYHNTHESRNPTSTRRHAIINVSWKIKLYLKYSISNFHFKFAVNERSIGLARTIWSGDLHNIPRDESHNGRRIPLKAKIQNAIRSSFVSKRR